jgi:MFS superfamily sulfate permease-like transporter
MAAPSSSSWPLGSTTVSSLSANGPENVPLSRYSANPLLPNTSSASTWWLTGLLHDVPKVALAAIVIYAAAGLFEIGALTRLYRQNRSEFAVAIFTFAGVVVLGMLVGILTAVFLSLALQIAKISRPRAVVIGALDGSEGSMRCQRTRGWRPPQEPSHSGSTHRSFFANADYFVEHATQVFDEATPHRLVSTSRRSHSST